MTQKKPDPLERYAHDLEHSNFIPDPVQKQAVQLMQSLYATLLGESRRQDRFLTRLFRQFFKVRKKPVKGYYFWGGVGRGKTYIVDAFYDCLPFEKKRRIHFHRFMQRVHHELRELKNVEDPLQRVADGFARETLVLCFDEFYVADITDAMLLGGLLKALFERGITLVATSNEHPDRLYWGGLQRERFLPAIELLKEFTYVVNLNSGIDYRLRYLNDAEIYHCPVDEKGRYMLLSNFTHLAPDGGVADEVIEIEERNIRTVRCAYGVVWFDFHAICAGPRGPADYIEIGRLFHTVLIAGIPRMDDSGNDLVKRFITLVDEFYDRNVKLILTAACAPQDLYTGQRLAGPFQRTVSRLIEMQSHEYLSRPHLPD